VFNLPQDVPGLYDSPAEPPKPVIVHEAGNFGTFPLLDQVEIFEHNIKPFWFVSAREKVANMGLLDEVEDWARNSQHLYYLCHKLNIEDIRKHSYISGHHWWLFQDYWTGSNGLVESYFRPKEHIDPAMVRRFVNDIVLLEDGLQWSYRAGDAVNTTLLVSNFAESPLAEPVLSWKVECDGKTLQENTHAVPSPAQGAVTSLEPCQFTCPEVTGPQLLTLSVSLATSERSVENAWTTWVYPKDISPTLQHPVYATAEWLDALAPFGAKAILDAESLPADAAYATTTLSRKLLDAAKSGACLLLLNPPGLLPAANNRFKTTWWLGNARDSNVGTVVYDNPVTEGLAPEGWCDTGWYRLLEGAQAYLLDDAPARPDILIRGIDVHRLCREKALLLEVRVGEGSIIVSGLNLEDESGNAPEKAWLKARLLEHAASLPRPQAEWPVAYFEERAFEAPTMTGPFIAGFAAADAEKGQPWPSYREEEAPYFILRQTSETNRLEWTTAPVPETIDSDHVTFVFAGGLGWRSEPETPGFAFCVNGKRMLDFDVTDAYHEWRDDATGIALVFLPKRQLHLDTVGLFFVTVPKKRLTPGKACTFAVESKGSGSQRWFGLNPYTDVAPGQ